MQAQSPPLAGFKFNTSLPSKTSGSITSKVDITPTSTREPSVGSKSVYSFSGEDSSSECEEYDFFESDHSKMPSTREPSPEPFSDTAKRYGWSLDSLSLESRLSKQDMFPVPQYFQKPFVPSSTPRSSSPMKSSNA